MSVKPRPEILEINPYRPGKPVAEVERELGIKNAIKLASNEATGIKASPKAVAAAIKELEKIHFYPESACPDLSKALAQQLGFTPEHFIFGNGSNDILELIAKTYVCAGEEVLFGDPSFIVYDIAARIPNGVPVRIPLKDWKYDLDAILARITPKTKLIFIANPNNPTGTVVDPAAADRFVRNLPDGVLLCWDEAYLNFGDPGTIYDATQWVKDGLNVLVTRSFAKVFGLAGLRIGYSLGMPELIEPMHRIRQPFNVNLIAQAAALAALEDHQYLKEHYELIKKGREQYYKALDEMGMKYLPTQANFIAIYIGPGMLKVYDQLLHEGIIVRPLAGPWGMPEWIRVTFSSLEHNEAFLKALRKVLGKA
jgi:histidinol-phosphate aminotransferase